MPDLDDDWMNPPPPVVYRARDPQDVPKFLIQRARKRTTFGDPGYIIEWDYWSGHATAKERDAELKKLREAHPVWRLRKADLDHLGRPLDRDYP